MAISATRMSQGSIICAARCWHLRLLRSRLQRFDVKIARLRSDMAGLALACSDFDLQCKFKEHEYWCVRRAILIAKIRHREIAVEQG